VLGDRSGLTVEQKRRVEVQDTAHTYTAEIRRLRRELGLCGPPASSVLSKISPQEVLEHVLGLEIIPNRPLTPMRAIPKERERKQSSQPGSHQGPTKFSDRGESSKEQPWNADAPEYLYSSEAIKLCDDRLSLSSLIDL